MERILGYIIFGFVIGGIAMFFTSQLREYQDPNIVDKIIEYKEIVYLDGNQTDMEKLESIKIKIAEGEQLKMEIKKMLGENS